MKTIATLLTILATAPIAFSNGISAQERVRPPISDTDRPRADADIDPTDRERLAPKPIVTDAAPLQLEVVVPQDKDRWSVRVTVQDTATVAILISDTDRVLPISDAAPLILESAGILALGRTHMGEFLADAQRVAIADLDLFVQAVALYQDGSIRATPITPVAFGDERVAPSDSDDTDRDPSAYDGPPMIARQLDGKGIFVEFQVPSNDYALFHDHNRESEQGTDVYLFLEEPGQGQGLFDVVEYHSMAIGVSRENGDRVRVFVARAPRLNDSDTPQDAREYKLAATFWMR